MLAEMISAIAVVAGIGYGLDRLLGTWPALFAVGAVIGNGMGVYMVYRRSLQMTSDNRGPDGQ
jgi:F0F1-type ATP synthase assembly protein I